MVTLLRTADDSELNRYIGELVSLDEKECAWYEWEIHESLLSMAKAEKRYREHLEARKRGIRGTIK